MKHAESKSPSRFMFPLLHCNKLWACVRIRSRQACEVSVGLVGASLSWYISTTLNKHCEGSLIKSFLKSPSTVNLEIALLALLILSFFDMVPTANVCIGFTIERPNE